MMVINTIATHPRDDSVGIFRNSVALVWPLWLEGRCQASNVEVVAGDLFATPNPLISHTQKNLLSPFSNIAPWQRLVQSGFYEVALMTVQQAPSHHATSQNPQD